MSHPARGWTSGEWDRGEGEREFWDIFKKCLHCTDASGLEQPAQQSLHLRPQEGWRRRGASEAGSSCLLGERSQPHGREALEKCGPLLSCADVDRGPSSPAAQ